jgi:hypothetical protein
VTLLWRALLIYIATASLIFHDGVKMKGDVSVTFPDTSLTSYVMAIQNKLLSE